MSLLLAGSSLIGCDKEFDSDMEPPPPTSGLLSGEDGDRLLAEPDNWVNAEKDALCFKDTEGLFRHIDFETRQMILTEYTIENDSLFLLDTRANLIQGADGYWRFPWKGFLIQWDENEVTLYNFNGKEKDTYTRPLNR